MVTKLGRLPTEIILEIFSHLGYFDLKRCIRVCKSFNLLLKSTSHFNSALFRSKPLENHPPWQAIPGDKHILPDALELHPAFSAIHYRYTQHTGDVMIGGKELTTLSVAKENANNPGIVYAIVFPPCLELSESSWEITGTGENKALTVGDLMETLVSMVETYDEDGGNFEWNPMGFRGWRVGVYKGTYPPDGHFQPSQPYEMVEIPDPNESATPDGEFDENGNYIGS